MAFISFKSCVLLAAALLGGCAGGSRPPGSAVALAVPADEAAPVPDRVERIPAAADIFDFHPRGAPPGSWREPFVVSYTEGPLNAYRLRTLAELRRLADHRYDIAAAPR